MHSASDLRPIRVLFYARVAARSHCSTRRSWGLWNFSLTWRCAVWEPVIGRNQQWAKGNRPTSRITSDRASQIGSSCASQISLNTASLITSSLQARLQAGLGTVTYVCVAVPPGTLASKNPCMTNHRALNLNLRGTYSLEVDS